LKLAGEKHKTLVVIDLNDLTKDRYADSMEAILKSQQDLSELKCIAMTGPKICLLGYSGKQFYYEIAPNTSPLGAIYQECYIEPNPVIKLMAPIDDNYSIALFRSNEGELQTSLYDLKKKELIKKS
jgi:hypothetical protein